MIAESNSMPNTPHQSDTPNHDVVEAANQRETAAAVLLKELDEQQETVLHELDQLNDDIENLIDSWRGQSREQSAAEELAREACEQPLSSADHQT